MAVTGEGGSAATVRLCMVAVTVTGREVTVAVHGGSAAVESSAWW